MGSVSQRREEKINEILGRLEALEQTQKANTTKMRWHITRLTEQKRAIEELNEYTTNLEVRLNK